MNARGIADRLRRQEDRNFDFKAAMDFSGDFRAGLTIDIAAMANTAGGGTLVIGVPKVNGLWAPTGLNGDQLATYDTTRMVQFIKNVLDPLPHFEIETVEFEGKALIVLSIVEFEDVPIVVKKTIQCGQNLFARDGDLLIRSVAAESRAIQSADELRQLLGRALSRKSENLLADIRAVVTGAGPRHLEETPQDLFEKQLSSWPQEVAAFDQEHMAHARWEVKVLPLPAREALEPHLAQMTLRDAKVAYRGWDFPHIPMNQAPLFGMTHLDLRTASQEFHEFSLFSYQGAFGFESVIWTELLPKSKAFPHPLPPARILDATGILWSLTEFFRFALNLAERLSADGIWISVALKGVKDRSIGSFDPGRMWWGDRQSRTSEIPLEGYFTVADLKSSWKDRTREWARKIFTVFQWPDANDSDLQKDQERLLERRF